VNRVFEAESDSQEAEDLKLTKMKIIFSELKCIISQQSTLISVGLTPDNFFWRSND